MVSVPAAASRHTASPDLMGRAPLGELRREPVSDADGERRAAATMNVHMIAYGSRPR